MFKGGWGLRNGEFDQPRGLAFSANGNLFVSDFRNYRVQEFTDTGEYQNKIGWESKGNKEGQFNDAYGVYVASNNNVLVLDTWNGRVQVFNKDGNFITLYKPEIHPGLFAPKGITMHDNKIYLTDTGNHRVVILSRNGKVLNKLGGPGTDQGEFNAPCGIAVDKEGYIYVADPGNNRIQVLKPDGQFDRAFEILPFEDKPYKEPYLVLSKDGFLYMTHPHKNSVYKYSLDGTMVGRKAGLNTPTGIAIHPKTGEIYVSNTFGHRIVKFKPGEFGS
jgi:DNA-binding beta-propeller fold protein YncE